MLFQTSLPLKSFKQKSYFNKLLRLSRCFKARKNYFSARIKIFPSLRVSLSAPWKGAELQWESKPTRQLSLQPVAAEAWMEEMKSTKPLVQKARKRASE